MRSATFLATAALLALSTTTNATVFSFNTDPFAGSDALAQPGRQIVGNERFIEFNPATDLFKFESGAFGTFGINDIRFFNGLSSNLPDGGVNVIVLQNADVPFAAGIAANLIAAEITQPGAGFFIYFNSGLNLPRLVFSTNLDDNQADLKVLARMTNLSGPGGRAQLPNFTEANFAVPEPSSLLLLIAGALGIFGLGKRRAATGRWL